VSDNNTSPTTTVGILAKLFNLTEMRVQQLAKLGVTVKTSHGRYDLWASVKGYIHYLQERAGVKSATNDPEDEFGDYHKHRARLYRAKAESAEIEVNLMKGEVHESNAVKKVWDDMISNAKAKLLSLPVKVAPRLEGVTGTQEIKDILDNAVNEALNELSNYNPDRVTQTFVQNRQSKVVTPTEDDSEQLG
jgi:phage terminase Nu1 subunit (DNA packaging protein)